MLVISTYSIYIVDVQVSSDRDMMDICMYNTFILCTVLMICGAPCTTSFFLFHFQLLEECLAVHPALLFQTGRFSAYLEQASVSEMYIILL